MAEYGHDGQDNGCLRAVGGMSDVSIKPRFNESCRFIEEVFAVKFDEGDDVHHRSGRKEAPEDYHIRRPHEEFGVEIGPIWADSGRNARIQQHHQDVVNCEESESQVEQHDIE